MRLDNPVRTEYLAEKSPPDPNLSSQLAVLQVNAQAGTEQYRVYNVSEQLEIAGIKHRVLNLSDLYAKPNDARKLFNEFSMIIFHRIAYDSLLASLCEEARTEGAILVYETDDLTFYPNLDPRWVDGLRYLSSDEIPFYYEGVERYEKMMWLCDAGLFSTGFLARLATRQGMRSWVLRNALGKPYLDAAERAYKQGKRQKRRSGVCLGYCSGTKTHDRDFAQFASTLLRLMEKNSRLELAILGHLALPAEFSRFKARIHRHAPVPWRDVPETLASFDINLSPLEARNPF